jgi:hypothetical protein
MEETVNQPACYLDRETPIQRLPQLVFAASQAWKQGGAEAHLGKTAFTRALAAKCSLCGFALSGEELLVLSEIAPANEKSAMLKRLRSGHCACEGCPSRHYRLLFFDLPPVSWEFLLAQYRAKEAPPPPSQPAEAQVRFARHPIPLHTLGRIAAVAGICLLTWMWWRWYNGETILLIRQPAHFRVESGPDAVRYH